MWRYFWSYQTDLPPESGFEPFSAPHLAWVFTALALIALTAYLYHRRPAAARRRWERVLAITLAMAGIDIWVNSRIGSNFMFLSDVPADTFWKPIADWFGYPGYQAAMAGLLLLVWVLLYAPWVIARRSGANRQPGTIRGV